jgi:hypothetical protein
MKDAIEAVGGGWELEVEVVPGPEVLVTFAGMGEPVWWGMPPAQAREFAALLMKHADRAEGKTT